MKNVLKPVLMCMAAASMLTSCLKGQETDNPDFLGYMTVTVNADGTFFFTSDNGDTFYPGDLSRIGKYDTEDSEGVSKDGNRAFVFFSFLKADAPDGSDYNIAVYRVTDISSKDIDVLASEEDADEVYGDETMNILNNSGIQGEWLDIGYVFITDGKGKTKHTVTLLDNTSAEIPEDMPKEYVYLELRHKSDDDIDYGVYYEGNVSYRLGDILKDKKGLYVRYKTLDGSGEDGYRYAEFKAPEKSVAAARRGAMSVSGAKFVR